MLRRLAGCAVVWVVLVPAVPAMAAESVTLIPDEGTEFTINGKTYAGEVTITASASGLVLTETTSVDDYLAGIKEVPFGWPEEALAAQVVAARTYLANTLAGGRSERGRAYGYDICASSACQVYAGTGYLDEPSGERWLDAVARTRGEILTFDGAPILAVYSSSAGSRTMAVQDVWGGTPLPYLQPVDSPEEGVSPFAAWQVEVPPAAFIEILGADGYDVSGRLRALEHLVPPEGEGIATVLVATTGGTATIEATDLKGAMNRHGTDLYPEILPGVRSDGKQLPQALPSYNYDVSFFAPRDMPHGVLAVPGGEVFRIGAVRFTGEGWGHNLGMSQYGALAMAQEGATYDEILAHYYGGLTPEDAGPHLPEEVVIGLGWDLDAVTIDASGPFEVAAVGPRSGGTWTVFPADGAAVLFPFVGYPVLPDLPRRLTPL